MNRKECIQSRRGIITSDSLFEDRPLAIMEMLLNVWKQWLLRLMAARRLFSDFCSRLNRDCSSRVLIHMTSAILFVG